MTFTENILDAMVSMLANLEQKCDVYYEEAKKGRTQAPRHYWRYPLGQHVAYAAVGEEFKETINAVTKFVEPLENLKQYIKQYGVKQWLEAGIDVLYVSDAWLDENETFARLETYDKRNTLHFCGYLEMMTGKCGQIVLNNGRVICYNIYSETNQVQVSQQNSTKYDVDWIYNPKTK